MIEVKFLVFEGRDRLDDGTPLSMTADLLVKAGVAAENDDEEQEEFGGRDRYIDDTPLN